MKFSHSINHNTHAWAVHILEYRTCSKENIHSMFNRKKEEQCGLSIYFLVTYIILLTCDGSEDHLQAPVCATSTQVWHCVTGVLLVVV